MAVCKKCGKNYWSCSLCMGQYPHDECADDTECYRCDEMDAKPESSEGQVERVVIGALISKYEEYIAFLGKGSLFEAIHGGCSQEDYLTGEKLRKEIAELKERL